MNLLIVRHAIAVDHGDPGFRRDDDRPLTPDGIHKFRLAARGIQEVAPKLDRIVSSPLVRARQTADILRDTLAPHVEIEFTPLLINGADFGDLVAHVTGLGAANVALVGHNPHVSEFAAYLLGGRGASSILFKKGAAALVSFPDAPAPGRGTLEWLIQPGALRDIGSK